MRVEFLRGHVADLEQLHEAQEVIRLFLEAQKHHLASSPYAADAVAYPEDSAAAADGGPTAPPAPAPPSAALAEWEERLPQPSGASLRDKALRTYCDAVLAFIRRPSTAITQRQVRRLLLCPDNHDSPQHIKKRYSPPCWCWCPRNHDEQLDEHVSVLAAALEQGESRERLNKIHANTLLLKRIIAAYYKEFVQLPLLR